MGIIGTIIGRVLDHEIEKHIHAILETRTGYNQKVPFYNTPGDASVPCKEDRILIVKLEGTTGKFVAIGMLVESQDAKPGEKIFYARDKDSNIVSKLSMFDQGNILIDTEKETTDATGDYTKVIKGNVNNTIRKDKDDVIEGSETRHIDKDKTEDVVGNNNLTIIKNNNMEVGGDYNMNVGGNLNINVSGAVTINGAVVNIN